MHLTLFWSIKYIHKGEWLTIIYNHMTNIFVKKKKSLWLDHWALVWASFLYWKIGKRGYFSRSPYSIINWKQIFWSTRYNNHVWCKVQAVETWNMFYVFLIKQRLLIGRLFFRYLFSIFYFPSEKSANQFTKCPDFLSWLFLECC